MQHILIDIRNNQLFLQCAEIVKQGEISILNKEAIELLSFPIINNNFINIDLHLPPGNYQLILKEETKTWKRNFKL